MSALLVGIAATAGAAIGADLLTAHLGVRRARAALREHLGTDVSIGLGGWPRTPRLLLRGGTDATLSATDVPLQDGVNLTALAVSLHGVRFERGRGAPDRLCTAGGRFQARLDTEAVRALTPLPGIRDITLEDGRVRYLLPGGVRVTGRLTVDPDGDLTFAPEGGPLDSLRLVRIAAPIGRLPMGASIDAVGTEAGAVVVEGEIGASTVDLGDGEPA